MGTTRYPSGELVMPNDTITPPQVFEFLTYDLVAAENAVASLVKPIIVQQKFDALVDFTYNLGILAFRNSTLLKVINANPSDPNIDKQFNRWILAAGKPLDGLIRRRQSECWLYFNGDLKFQF